MEELMCCITEGGNRVVATLQTTYVAVGHTHATRFDANSALIKDLKGWLAPHPTSKKVPVWLVCPPL